MPVSKTMTILNNYGKPLAQVSEYISRDTLRGTTIKCREFKPLSSKHFLATDCVNLFCSKDLKTGKKSLQAYSGDPVDGNCITSGVDNVKKLIKSIKQGIHVNTYDKNWHKQVFGE